MSVWMAVVCGVGRDGLASTQLTRQRLVCECHGPLDGLAVHQAHGHVTAACAVHLDCTFILWESKKTLHEDKHEQKSKYAIRGIYV